MTALLLSLAGCDKSRSESPADAYTVFSRAAQRGDAKAGYAALSKPCQENLSARAKEISAASGGAIKNDPAALAFSGPPRPDPLSEVNVVRQSGERAVLAVTSTSGSHQVAMVREEQGWKVDVNEALAATERGRIKP
jgi:hypothetical protein